MTKIKNKLTSSGENEISYLETKMTPSSYFGMQASSMNPLFWKSEAMICRSPP